MKKMIYTLIILTLSVFLFAEENTEGLNVNLAIGNLDTDIMFQESVTGVSQSTSTYEVDGWNYLGLQFDYQFLNSEWPQLMINIQGQMGRPDGKVKQTLAKIDGEYKQWDFGLGWESFKSPGDALRVNLITGFYYVSFDFEEANSQSPAALQGYVGKYGVHFKGTYFGLGSDFTVPGSKFEVSANVKYIPRIRASGDVTDVVNEVFKDQDATGDGVLVNIAASYGLNENWWIGASLTTQDFEADGAFDQRPLRTGVTTSTHHIDTIENDTTLFEIKTGYLF